MHFLRLFLASIIFLQINLFAKDEPIKVDFKACYKKNINNFVKTGGKSAILLGNNRAILFSRRYLRGFLKRDPFLGLYLFRVNSNRKGVDFYPFKEIQENISVISRQGFKLNKITSLSNGLNKSASLKKSSKANSLVECVCCKSFGLSSGGKSFIDSDFIINFLKTKRVEYGDSGLRFKEKNSKIVVSEKNPFFKDNPLIIGDEILSIDEKTFKNVSALSKYILFLKPGKKIKITYKRGDKIHKFILTLRKRVSGGLIGETFLESIGLFVGYNLKIKYITKGSIAYKLGLKRGDRLMKLSKSYIKSYKDIKKALLSSKEKVLYLLFSRDDFQFFVHFRR